MKRSIKSILSVAGGVLIIATSAAALAIKVKKDNAKPQVDKQPESKIFKAKIYDPKLLDTLSRVVNEIDLNTGKGSYQGSYSLTDLDDSTQSTSNIPYLLCKSEKDCYYRLGQIETYNAEGVYLCIDNRQKKILLSGQKEINISPVGNLETLKKGMVTENYTLSSRRNGPVKTIRLVNEKHITCKEYAISFDTLTKHVTRIFVRASNFQDPLNQHAGKIYDLRFTAFDRNANVSRYLVKDRVFHQNNGKIVLENKYKDYELLRADQ